MDHPLMAGAIFTHCPNVMVNIGSSGQQRKDGMTVEVTGIYRNAVVSDTIDASVEVAFREHTNKRLNELFPPQGR